MNPILIVDDEDSIVEYLQSILEDEYSIDTAQNGIEAVRKLEKNKYSLIISDIIMPDMNGIELIKKIRENDSDIPIIALSGYPKDLNQTCLLGATICLVKPFVEDDLVSAVKSVIGDSR